MKGLWIFPDCKKIKGIVLDERWVCEAVESRCEKFYANFISLGKGQDSKLGPQVFG